MQAGFTTGAIGLYHAVAAGIATYEATEVKPPRWWDEFRSHRHQKRP